MEARFLVTMDRLPLGSRRAFSHGKDQDIDNDKTHLHLGLISPSLACLLGGLLSRVGRFVRRIDLRCKEDSIDDGILDVLVGPHRSKV
jgi:hypothetical protein